MKNDNNILVTVYLVNYNYGQFIEQSIQSVLNQTLKNYELIIIDDGSTDNSKEIIKKYEHLDNVFTVFQKNKGLIKTNNVALGLARGKYIMRLDADDYLTSEALMLMSTELNNDDDLSLVFPDYYNVDQDGAILNQYKRIDFTDENLLLEKPAHGAVTMIRTKILKEVGGYDEEFNCQDGYDLWLKIFKSYKIKNISTPLFHYRQHGSNLTKNQRHLYKTRAQMMQKYVNKHKMNKISTTAVIPVRGSDIDTRSTPMITLNNKMLIQWTIDEALKSNKIENIVVTTPDKNLIKELDKIYENKVLFHHRQKSKAQINSSITNTLYDVCEYLSKNDQLTEAILTLYIEYPFRCLQYMEKAINHMSIYEVEAVESVVNDNSIFYHHDGKSLKRINNESFLRLEQDDLFKRSGGIHLIKSSVIKERKDLFNIKTGHIMVDDLASFQIKSQLDFKIASYLSKEFNDVNLDK